MATEPTQEQLSAYVDGELDGPARGELDTHLATCSTCQARLDGLREVVTAIRALPMETPHRTFTVPAQRRQARSWAPLGWGIPAMAAAVFAIFFISQLHPGGGATSSSGTANFASAPLTVAPLSQPQLGAAAAARDSYSATPAKTALAGQQRTVSVPDQPGRSLTLSTDARSYGTKGVLTLRVTTQGLSTSEASTVRILLQANGYSARLTPPATGPAYPLGFDASYAIADLHLPQAGTYTLQVTLDLADGSSLVDDLPIALTP